MRTQTRTFNTVAWATAGACMCLFLLGFTDNLKGPTLPAMLEDLQFSYAQGASILLGSSFGFLFATLIAGILNDLIGSRLVVLASGLSLLLGISGYSLMDQPALLTIGMLLMGLGFGSLNVSGSSIVVASHPGEKGRYMNLMAFFHGMASTVAPFFAGRLLVSGFSWRSVYQWALIPVAILLVYFFFLPMPHIRQVKSQGTTGRFDWQILRKSAFSPAMILFYAIGILYIGAEIGAGAWMVEFLQTAKGQSVSQSALYLSLFWGAIMLGRLLGSIVVERIGYMRGILIMALGGTFCLAVGTFGPPALTFFLPLTGLFFAIIFPTTTAAISDYHPENVNTIIGLFLTAGGIGGVLGSGSVGYLSDFLGIQIGFGVTTLYSLLTVIAVIVLLRITNAQAPLAARRTQAGQE